MLNYEISFITIKDKLTMQQCVPGLDGFVFNCAVILLLHYGSLCAQVNTYSGIIRRWHKFYAFPKKRNTENLLIFRLSQNVERKYCLQPGRPIERNSAKKEQK